MAAQNSNLLFLLAISYTQNVHNIEYATKLLKRDFPAGKIEYINLDGVDVVMSKIYNKEGNTVVSSEFIIIDK